MTLPRITVVVPSFNQAAYLDEALASIVEQRYPNLELIVMDGGSTDGSVDVIRRYEDHISYWQSQPDGGQSAAIHAGFERATGDILGWLNSDDVLCGGGLWSVGETFSARPDVQWLYGETLIIDRHSTLVERRRTIDITLTELVNVDYYLPQESTYFRRSLYFEVGGLDRSLHFAMDYDLWLRMAHVAPPLRVPFLIGKFRYLEGQKSSDVAGYKAEELRAKARYADWRLSKPEQVALFLRVKARTAGRRLVHDGPVEVLKKEVRILRGDGPKLGSSKVSAAVALATPTLAAVALIAGLSARTRSR